MIQDFCNYVSIPVWDTWLGMSRICIRIYIYTCYHVNTQICVKYLEVRSTGSNGSLLIGYIMDESTAR